MSADIETLDLVVVGAGLYGLAAAKQYHELHPASRMAVLDSSPTLGGVWGSHRIYPGLHSNNLLGTYEFPDFPMDSAVFDVQRGKHPTGEAIHAYQEAYAKKFGIFELIRFETKVISAEHLDSDNRVNVSGGWLLSTVQGFNSGDEALKETKLFTRALIIATGLRSRPFLPKVDGQEKFGAPLFHSVDFPKHADTFGSTKTVTVFGATKSGWDAVYAYGIRGIKVNWVFRASGHGPCWMAPPYVTPFKRWIEHLANTRYLTFFSPCVWGQADGFVSIRQFLHGSWLGRAIVNAFWSVLGNDVKNLCGFSKNKEIAKLQPWNPAMFTADSFSILNYDTDFFELLRNGTVKVHIADIERLSPSKVHLSDGAEFESEALVCVTGWNHSPSIKFLPEGIEKELGLPHILTESELEDPVNLASQSRLIEKADEEIFRRFPRLRDQPQGNKKYQPLEKQIGISTDEDVTPQSPLTQYMLHRFMVPASPRLLKSKDIAFCGMVTNFSNPICAHLQALWVSAYFDGDLAKDPSMALLDQTGAALEDLKFETVLVNRSLKWRYPAEHRFPSFIFDAVPYLDVLMTDLGLEKYRKKGFLNNLTDPYGPADYKDVNNEWKKMYGR